MCIFVVAKHEGAELCILGSAMSSALGVCPVLIILNFDVQFESFESDMSSLAFNFLISSLHRPWAHMSKMKGSLPPSLKKLKIKEII